MARINALQGGNAGFLTFIEIPVGGGPCEHPSTGAAHTAMRRIWGGLLLGILFAFEYHPIPAHYQNC